MTTTHLFGMALLGISAAAAVIHSMHTRSWEQRLLIAAAGIVGTWLGASGGWMAWRAYSGHSDVTVGWVGAILTSIAYFFAASRYFGRR